jgi:hypothetical protein
MNYGANFYQKIQLNTIIVFDVSYQKHHATSDVPHLDKVFIYVSQGLNNCYP